MNRFYIPEHCSTELRIPGISLQLRWINAGTISKEVELRNIHLISRFITKDFIFSAKVVNFRETENIHKTENILHCLIFLLVILCK